MKFKVIGGVIAAFLLSSCAIPQHQNLVTGIKKGVFYKRDMRIEYDGHKGIGVLVLPEKILYDSIEIKAKGRLDLFTFETCHAVPTREDAWDENGARAILQYGIQTEIAPNANIFDSNYGIGNADLGNLFQNPFTKWDDIIQPNPVIRLLGSALTEK